MISRFYESLDPTSRDSFLQEAARRGLYNSTTQSQKTLVQVRKQFARKSIPVRKFVLTESTEKTREQRMHSHLVSICSSQDKLKFGIAEVSKPSPLVIDLRPKITV
jgi:hypothetical protein